MENNQKDQNELVSKTVKVPRYIVDWVLGTRMPFSTYVRIFLEQRHEAAQKREPRSETLDPDIDKRIP